MNSNGGENSKLTPQKRWVMKNPKLRWAVDSTYKAKRRSKDTVSPFDIDSKYVFSIIPDKCPVFGNEFKFSGSKVCNDDSPTIDKLNPAKGYTKGNIVVISRKANSIKSAYKSEDILAVGLWLKQKGL